jgi:hypothetical protein
MLDAGVADVGDVFVGVLVTNGAAPDPCDHDLRRARPRARGARGPALRARESRAGRPRDRRRGTAVDPLAGLVRPRARSAHRIRDKRGSRSPDAMAVWPAVPRGGRSARSPAAPGADRCCRSATRSSRSQSRWRASSSIRGEHILDFRPWMRREWVLPKGSVLGQDRPRRRQQGGLVLIPAAQAPQRRRSGPSLARAARGGEPGRRPVMARPINGGQHE